MKRTALFSFFMVGALALAVPPSALTSPAAQEHKEKAEVRVYDKDHHDYHVWNDVEDHAYRAWLDTKHFTYRQYSKLKGTDRSDYWKWRHEHETDDHR